MAADYAESQFNRALKARRQPGSAFKLFVYLAALESGLTPTASSRTCPCSASGWSPRNEGAGYRGAVSLREALAHSMNAAAVRLNMTVGRARRWRLAHRLGIRSELRADASLALGTSEVTLLELTGAYGVLANGGRTLEPHSSAACAPPRARCCSSAGRERQKCWSAPAPSAPSPTCWRAWSAAAPASARRLPTTPAAGKTGTSQDFRDAWFVGYTAQLIAGVWVGNDDGRPMRRVVGGTLPARLWHDVMMIAHEGLPARGLAGAPPSERAALPGRRPAPAADAAASFLPGERSESEPSAAREGPRPAAFNQIAVR